MLVTFEPYTSNRASTASSGSPSTVLAARYWRGTVPFTLRAGSQPCHNNHASTVYCYSVNGVYEIKQHNPYSSGNNKGNFHFVYKCAGTEGEILENSQTTLWRVVPTFHTRAMRKLTQEKFGHLSPKIKTSSVSFHIQRAHW